MISGPGATVAAFVCAGISFLFVGLRLYTRFRIKHHQGWDDVMVTIALVFSILLCPTYYFQLKYGMGTPLAELDPAEHINQSAFFWASTWVYVLGVAFAKLSILAQFLRVFLGQKTRLACWFIVGFIITCCLVCLFGGIFACTPIERFWDHSVPGYCIQYVVIWYMHAAMAIITDIGIIAIPIPTVANMTLGRKKKISLAFTFALGGFGCITSVFRLYYLYFDSVTTDPTAYNPLPALWSTVELNTVIVCACLITLHPLLVLILSPIVRFTSSFSNRSLSIGDILPSANIATNKATAYGTRSNISREPRVQLSPNNESEVRLAPDEPDGIKVRTVEHPERSAQSLSGRSVRILDLERGIKTPDKDGWVQQGIELHEIV